MEKYDVVVVGSGNAALCAALSARDNGAKKVLIMGDARFEQKVPSHQIFAASKLKKIAFKKYFTICFASIGKQEFTIISEIIRDLHEKYKDIFFILVPRHPNDFDKYKTLFENSSIKVNLSKANSHQMFSKTNKQTCKKPYNMLFVKQ